MGTMNEGLICLKGYPEIRSSGWDERGTEAAAATEVEWMWRPCR